MLHKLINIGTNKTDAIYLQWIIRLSNQIALLIAVLGFLFMGFSTIFAPLHLMFPAIVTFIAVTSIVLNFIGKYVVSRMLLNTGIVFILFLYHSFVVPTNGSIIPSLYFLGITLAVIP